MVVIVSSLIRTVIIILYKCVTCGWMGIPFFCGAHTRRGFTCLFFGAHTAWRTPVVIGREFNNTFVLLPLLTLSLNANGKPIWMDGCCEYIQSGRKKCWHRYDFKTIKLPVNRFIFYFRYLKIRFLNTSRCRTKFLRARIIECVINTV